MSRFKRSKEIANYTCQYGDKKCCKDSTEIVGRWILESLICARETEMSDKLKARAKQLKNDVPAVFLSLKDKDTPVVAKIVAAITVAYALSPIDLIPDFIPVLGYLDDVILLPAFIAWTIRLIPKDIWEKNKQNAEDMWKDGRPKKWFCAIPIILLWVLIIWLIMKVV